MKTLMVQGTASGVGKSLLVTALCRIYARRGLKVAPFKSQNMSLNAAVTADGAEIGRAQFAQAIAARAIPSADMNPVLLKPEGLTTSQVVVLGRATGSVHFADYFRRRDELRVVVGDALDRLRARYDLVILEGAGSPAEINLRHGDLVNMWMAERADAPVILVADIDRGGALAAMVGTLELLTVEERARVKALVINKFRGDVRLFDGGVAFLQERTGLPVIGVVTHMGDAGIASEDSLDLQSRGAGVRVAVIRFPRVSNFDEFEPLARIPGLELLWCERPSDLDGAKLVILPGSKCTVDDLAWLRQTGLASAIVERAQRGGRTLGICGGYQMMGERILDPLGVESHAPTTDGLGLLPVQTTFAPEKVTRAVEMEVRGVRARGYQIHCGRVSLINEATPFGQIDGEPEGAIVGAISGTTVHGLLESPELAAALAQSLGVQAAPSASDPYDTLADHFAAALRLDLIDKLIGL